MEIADDKDRELRVFRKMIRFTAFLVFPCLFGLSLVAEEFILVTISAKWIDSVPLLQILCVGGAFMPFYTMYQHLVISAGRSDIYMWCNIGQILLQIAIILAFHSFSFRCEIYKKLSFICIILMFHDISTILQISDNHWNRSIRAKNQFFNLSHCKLSFTIQSFQNGKLP